MTSAREPAGCWPLVHVDPPAPACHNAAVSLQQARQLVELRRWQEAADTLPPLLADPAAGADPWCLLAQCRLGLGQHKLAREAAAKGIAADPDEEWGHRLMAMAQLHGGRLRPALDSAERAMSLARGSALTSYTLVKVLLAQNNAARAQGVAERSLESNPHDPLAHESAAAVALKQRRWADAERFARAGLALDPQDGDLMMQLGTAQQGQGRRGEAADSYAAAVRVNPADHRGRHALGRIGLGVAAGGGAVGIKAILLLGFKIQLVVRGLVLARHHAGTVAILVAVVLLLVYGWHERRHRSALRDVAPGLRPIAARERRESGVRWLRAYAVFVLFLAAVAALSDSLVTAGWLVAVFAGVLALTVRLAPPVSGQSIRWLRR